MAKSKEKPFVPNNLAEILVWLDKNVPQAEKDYFVSKKPEYFHFSTGMAMRNSWDLWSQTSKIGQYFLSIGVFHGDDRSGIIMESFRRKLLGKPIDLLGQVKYYQDFWAKTSCAESKVTIEIDRKTKKYKIIQGK